MSKTQADKTAAMSDKEKKAAERAERLRKQLRDNLQRRKQQTRARKSDAEPKE
ncbi:hypothetical protein OAC63_05430 [Amylibacter sp.]|jgi:hypothetical protein|nr:hypothetical protein [Amylibacter sp.]